jgi:hypothetical protein
VSTGCGVRAAVTTSVSMVSNAAPPGASEAGVGARDAAAGFCASRDVHEDKPAESQIAKVKRRIRAHAAERNVGSKGYQASDWRLLLGATGVARWS